MSFQWLQLRIIEEQERRARETQILARLPGALDELRESLTNCVETYTGSFGAETAAMSEGNGGLTVAAEGEQAEVVVVPELPGFDIRNDGSSFEVRVGVLPGDKLFYLDVSADKYLSMDELTRKILDRVLFPKLKE